MNFAEDLRILREENSADPLFVISPPTGYSHPLASNRGQLYGNVLARELTRRVKRLK